MVFISLLEPTPDDAKRCCQLTRLLPLNYPSQLVGVTRGGLAAVTRAVKAWEGGVEGREEGTQEQPTGESSGSDGNGSIRSENLGSSNGSNSNSRIGINNHKSIISSSSSGANGSTGSRGRGAVAGRRRREWWRVDGGAFRCQHTCEKVGRGNKAFHECQRLLGTWSHFNVGWTWALSVPPPSTHPSKSSSSTPTSAIRGSTGHSRSSVAASSALPPPRSLRLASVGDAVCVTARSLFLTPHGP
ncbi:hypothetical protein CLOM_g13784 [Closterium sp. NIES-68]|nr:hypothetical protein CLOM_g13784 [Closterium sp. NIES-68]